MRPDPVREETGGGVLRVRKRPVEVAAMLVTRRNGAEVEAWCGGESYDVGMAPGLTHHVDIRTLEGTMRADVGDYVIRGVNGEFYPCKPDIFEKTYEPAPASSSKDEEGGLVRAATDDDARRDRAVAAMQRHARGLDIDYDADIEYLGDALVAFADEWASVSQQGTGERPNGLTLTDEDGDRVVFTAFSDGDVTVATWAKDGEMTVPAVILTPADQQRAAAYLASAPSLQEGGGDA